jgi:hypothetical protein
MQQFKQNQATDIYRRIFMFLASPADGYTPVTSLASPTVRLYSNGVLRGTQPGSPVPVHISSGHWYYELSSSDLSDLGILTVTVSDANIRTVVLMAQVVAYDPTASIQVTSIATDAITASSLASDAVTEIADGILAREIGSGSGAGTVNERTVRSALRGLRNKTTVINNEMTVYKEDDTSTAWSATVSSSDSSKTITGVDPA